LRSLTQSGQPAGHVGSAAVGVWHCIDHWPDSIKQHCCPAEQHCNPQHVPPAHAAASVSQGAAWQEPAQ
jgi:hypothetical protein